jgi:hypothetical protein
VLDVDKVAALYVELRDTKAKMKAELAEKLKPYNKGMEDLEAALLKHLEDQKAKSIRTESGTVYQRVKRSATIRDKLAFQEFIKENDLFDMLDWKANAVAVFDYMIEKAVDVPGINTSAFMTIGVRRGDAPQEDE